MKEQLLTLVQLQEIESEADLIHSRISEIRDKLTSLEEQRNGVDVRIEKETAELESFQNKYKGLEQTVKNNEAAIQKSRDRLNIVRNNKEYYAVSKGIDDIKRLNSDTESDMIGLLEQIDAKKKEIGDIEPQRETLNEQIEKEKKVIGREESLAEAKLSEIAEKRERVSETVSPDLLKRFQMVYERVAKPAIAPVRGIVCQGCNMNIPPQMRNDLKRYETLKFCPFCHRIIYWDQPEE